MTPIELLAPAKNADIALAALLHGADAIYMGASSHGARSAASNSLDDIARVAEAAHRYDARLYVTVNTLVYDRELRDVERLIRELYRCEVDALIIQDMGILRLDIPPIALHASTQCDIRTPEKAEFLRRMGFSRLVVPREMTLGEIRSVRDATGGKIELEAFVHGALCVSYSGDCQASCATTPGARSANRGECAQICRLPFDLTDGDGTTLVRGKHLLSLRDLNRSGRLAEMLDAGVCSFKIEGRLKDEAYVKNTVAAYRRLLDEAIAANPEKFSRLSCGRTETTFRPELSKSFNRGFTEYLGPDSYIASPDTPKWRGESVGIVSRSDGRRIDARLTAGINNGDGLAYFDASGEFHGFRVNRSEGQRTLYPATPETALRPGTELFRNRDKAWDDSLEGNTATRKTDVAFTLRLTPDGERIVLDAIDERGYSCSVALPLPNADKARTPQEENRRRTLEKTGNTVYRVTGVDDRADDRFVALSLLTELRRMCLDALYRTGKAAYRFDYRRKEEKEAVYPASAPLTYHDNVANRLAKKFYGSHGAAVGQEAFEVARPDRDQSRGPLTVMTSRYCIRRQMGRCLKTPEGRLWKGPLTITNPSATFSLEFDCRDCLMKVVLPGKKK